MNVSILGPYPVNETIHGGYEGAIFSLIESIQRRNSNINFSIFDTRSHLTYSVEKIRKNLTVYRLPFYRKYQLIRKGYPEIIKVRGLIRDTRPDVVHAHNLGLNSYIATKITPNNLVTIHGISQIEKKIGNKHLYTQVRTYFSNRFDNRNYQNANYIHHLTKHSLMQFNPSLNNKVVIIPNTIDKIFDNWSAPKDNSDILLIVGWLSELKNTIQALEWLENTKNIWNRHRIIFAGSFSNNNFKNMFLNKLKNSKIKENIHLAGQVDTNKLLNLYKKSSLLISFSKQENNPLSIIQAFGAGLPVLASCVGGVPEIVKDEETGMLFNLNDFEAFKIKLKKLLSDNKKRNSISIKANKEFKDNFSQSIISKKFIELYERIKNE